MNISRRNFMSALVAAGVILPTSASAVDFNILDHARDAWKSIKMAEISGTWPKKVASISMRDDGAYRILVSDADGRELLKLNSVAADIWQMCDGRNSVNDMVREITGRFDVKPGKCRKDILLTLMAFKGTGLISLS